VIHQLIKAAATAVIVAGVGLTPTGVASAFPNAGPVVAFGVPLQLDADNGVILGYTVDDFKPSTDPVEYPRFGHLWEATLTVEAIRGTATPILPFFNARARNGRQYRILFQAYAPAAISPGSLEQGQRSTGKIYFDCNGAPPEIVVYNDGAQDLLTWQ
jgi:Domain of unknown function (DUF1942)